MSFIHMYRFQIHVAFHNMIIILYMYILVHKSFIGNRCVCIYIEKLFCVHAIALGNLPL